LTEHQLGHGQMHIGVQKVKDYQHFQEFITSYMFLHTNGSFNIFQENQEVASAIP
jgi:hypothetical protein